MPCFRCGARQSDPVRGASPWKRGVRADRQVLICPGCQSSPNWTAELDRCAECGSTALICRLGEVECRSCGYVREARPQERPGDLVTSGAPGLSEEVAAALSRVLKRGPIG
ncbi:MULTISPECIES: hypothetical protein [Thermomonospora]|uniref:Uncharacterized protein n=1 Tax=Thermomonospora curvata (strain ATCC 19995 / DSM 43183 / JCM 3096 / KCTC 9072 / NBRC 15933 / NCIMB 10081 / Henssen B9) TaxID=471852 RepID=D1ABI9_THECD|nr:MULTISPECIES: hypothetical protein [Thermomonospora]ACY97225.1 hypothetical protein Tcur_1649 [Thermomonospora curvata DSM 43183]PKK14596.1 MAG: hypothetical protein BUE48_008085 [Thermomonospora sp. CIF 1]